MNFNKEDVKSIYNSVESFSPGEYNISLDEFHSSLENFHSPGELSNIFFSWENLETQRLFSFNNSYIFVHETKSSKIAGLSDEQKMKLLSEEAISEVLKYAEKDYNKNVSSCLSNLYSAYIDSIYNILSYSLRNSECLNDLKFFVSVPQSVVDSLPDKTVENFKNYREKFEFQIHFSDLEDYNSRQSSLLSSLIKVNEKIKSSSYFLFVDDVKRIGLSDDIKEYRKKYRKISDHLENNYSSGKVSFFSNGEQLDSIVLNERRKIEFFENMRDNIDLSFLFRESNFKTLSDEFNADEFEESFIGADVELRKVKKQEIESSNKFEKSVSRFGENVSDQFSAEDALGVVKENVNIDIDQEEIGNVDRMDVGSICNLDISGIKGAARGATEKSESQKLKEDALLSNEAFQELKNKYDSDEIFVGDFFEDSENFDGLVSAKTLEDSFELVLHRIDFKLLLQKLICCIAGQLDVDFDLSNFNSLSITLPKITLNIPSLHEIVSEIARRLLMVILNEIVKMLLNAIFDLLRQCIKNSSPGNDASASSRGTSSGDPASQLMNDPNVIDKIDDDDIDSSEFGGFFGDITSALTIEELCNLLRGRPDDKTLKIIKEILDCRDYNISDKFDSKKDVKLFFNSIGGVSFEALQGFCVNQLGVPPGGFDEFMCGMSNVEDVNEDLRESILQDKGLSDEHINNFLDQLKDRKEEQIKNVKNLLDSDAPMKNIIEDSTGQSIDQFVKSKKPSAKKNKNLGAVSNNVIQSTFESVFERFEREISTGRGHSKLFDLFVHPTFEDIIEDVLRDALSLNELAKKYNLDDPGAIASVGLTGIPAFLFSVLIQADGNIEFEKAKKNGRGILKSKQKLSEFYNNVEISFNGDSIKLSSLNDSIIFKPNGELKINSSKIENQQQELDVQFSVENKRGEFFDVFQENYKNKSFIDSDVKEYVENDIYNKISDSFLDKIRELIDVNFASLRDTEIGGQRIEPYPPPNYKVLLDIANIERQSGRNFKKPENDSYPDVILNSWFDGKNFFDGIVSDFQEAESDSKETRKEMVSFVQGGLTIIKNRIKLIEAFIKELPVSKVWGVQDLDLLVENRKDSKPFYDEGLESLLSRKEMEEAVYFESEKSSFQEEISNFVDIGDSSIYSIFFNKVPILENGKKDLVFGNKENFNLNHNGEPEIESLGLGYLKEGGLYFNRYIRMVSDNEEEIVNLGELGEYVNNNDISSYEEYYRGARLIYVDEEENTFSKTDEVQSTFSQTSTISIEGNEFDHSIIADYNLVPILSEERKVKQKCVEKNSIAQDDKKLVKKMFPSFIELLKNVLPVRIYMLLFAIYTREINSFDKQFLKETNKMLDDIASELKSKNVNDAASQHK